MHSVAVIARRCVAALAVVVSLWCGVDLSAQELPPAVPGSTQAGLNGLLPDTMPDDIAQAIDSLPDTWRDWGDGLREELNALHTGADATVEAQKARLASLREKANVAAQHAVDVRYAVARIKLLTLAGRLTRWLDLLDAALDTLTMEPTVRMTRAQGVCEQLVRSAQHCDGYLRTVQGGETWNSFLALPTAQQTAVSTMSQGVPVLAAVRTRLKTGELTDEQKVFVNKPALVAYGTAVDDYLAVAVNTQALADSGPARDAIKQLLSAYATYRVEKTRASAAAFRAAYEAVRATALDGGERICVVLRSLTFNFNTRTVASEPFINRLVSQCKGEPGVVDDVILEAKVDGCQFTNTQVCFDLIPSPCDARWDVTARGNIRAQTQAVKSIATIYGCGQHYFVAQKRVVFNGQCFCTEPARINVNASNRTVDAKTTLDCLPCIGKIARDIAFQQALEARTESETIARSKIAEKALPRMNYEVDQKFGEAGARFQNELVCVLRQNGIYPDAYQWMTTHTHLLANTRHMGSGELAGSVPPPYPDCPNGLAFQVHESLLNNVMDKGGFGGKTLTGDQFREELEAFVSRLLNRSISIPEPEKTEEDKPITFTFDQYDPIRIRLDDGQIQIAIKAALQREGDEPLPTQIVTSTFGVAIANDKLQVLPGDITVEPASGVASPTQLATSARIKQQLQKRMTPRDLERCACLPLENKVVQVCITYIEAVDGWLTMMVE